MDLIPNQAEVKKILTEVHLREKAPTAQPGLTIENLCVPGTTEGCYLVTVKFSEQAGLTGAKGSMCGKSQSTKHDHRLRNLSQPLERSWRSDVPIRPA
jgi:hypothetical protein